MAAPAVLSVEKFSIAMPDGTVSTPALSLGQNINNCVPFLTITCDTENNERQMVDVAKNTGTNKFDFVASTFGERDLEVTVVEFNPAEVTIQEVAFTLGSGLSVSVAVSAVVIANTFPIIYAQCPGDSLDNFSKILMRASITTTTNLSIIKDTHGANLTGHAYIVEALNGAWDIETGASIPINHAAGDTAKNVAITVVPARTGAWSYWDTAELLDDPRDAVWDTVITDATNLDLTKGNAAGVAGAGDIEVFVVNFAAEVAVVQQGEFNYITAATKTPTKMPNISHISSGSRNACKFAITKISEQFIFAPIKSPGRNQGYSSYAFSVSAHVSLMRCSASGL